MNQKWDKRFMDLAAHVATWSKDPSTQVGAVIVDDRKNIVGIGYNGFARGVEDSEERYNDRPVKYSMVVHAEANAIINANKSVVGCTIYSYPLFTCNECAKLIINSGIVKVVSPLSAAKAERWQSAYDTSLTMYEEAGVQVQMIGTFEPPEKK
jgi:dCMP deaminase